jgi:osmotically-inducible protein OsmY
MSRKRFDRGDWDREHFERSMDAVRGNQRDPDESYGTVGGTPYKGGVLSSGTYGSGAEFYSVTGMYENPLLGKHAHSHRGKAPRSYKRTDERILEDVCEQLAAHPLIDASGMDVHVDKGEVTLEGDVFDRRMKFMSEDVAANCTGVKEVHNRLLIVRRDNVA